VNICMIGAGYVGLVTGTCLAESGNEVICVDNDVRKVSLLKRGKIYIYEPGQGGKKFHDYLYCSWYPSQPRWFA